MKDLLASGVKAETVTEEMIRQIIDEPKPELLPLLAKLPEVKAPYAEAKLIVALACEGVLPLMSRSGARPAGPSPRAAGATSRAAALRTPLRQDISVTPSKVINNTKEKDVPNTRAANDTTFSWEEFLEKVKQRESGVYMKLTRVGHELNGNELHIYPNTKPTYNYLAKEHVKATLTDVAEGVKITIHEVGDAPSSAQKDETLDKISAIMGGEVVNDGGGNPF